MKCHGTQDCTVQLPVDVPDDTGVVKRDADEDAEWLADAQPSDGVRVAVQATSMAQYL